MVFETDLIMGGKIYILERLGERYTAMRTRLQRTLVFVLYQISLLAGITLLPVALLVRQVGLTLPVHRVVDRLESTYEHTKSVNH